MTVTVPGDEGNVNVTDATPEALVVARTFLPLLVPFESEPAEVVKKMPAPDFYSPDKPGLRVTVSGEEKRGSMGPGLSAAAGCKCCGRVARDDPAALGRHGSIASGHSVVAEARGGRSCHGNKGRPANSSRKQT